MSSKKIAKELALIDHEIRAHKATFAEISENLKLALDVMEDCGKAYRNANDATKRLMNQAIFEKFLVSNTEDKGLTAKPAAFQAPFDQILEPIKDDLAKVNRASQSQPGKLSGLIATAKDHIQATFGCGLPADQPSSIEITSNQSNFFGQISSSNNILVDLTWIEHATS